MYISSGIVTDPDLIEFAEDSIKEKHLTTHIQLEDVEQILTTDTYRARSQTPEKEDRATSTEKLFTEEKGVSVFASTQDQSVGIGPQTKEQSTTTLKSLQDHAEDIANSDQFPGKLSGSFLIMKYYLLSYYY